MYVDDGDFPTLAETGNESIQYIATKHQQTVNCWAGGFKTTGGALKPAKCFWNPIKWEWKQDKAQVKSNQNKIQYKSNRTRWYHCIYYKAIL